MFFSWKIIQLDKKEQEMVKKWWLSVWSINGLLDFFIQEINKVFEKPHILLLTAKKEENISILHHVINMSIISMYCIGDFDYTKWRLVRKQR